MLGFWRALYHLVRRDYLLSLKTALCDKLLASRKALTTVDTYDQGISLYQNPLSNPNQISAVNRKRRLREQRHWPKAEGLPPNSFSVRYQTRSVKRLAASASDCLREKQLSDSLISNLLFGRI